LKSQTVLQRKVPKFHDELFVWWRQNGRVLPWREKLGEKVVVEGDLSQGELRERAFKTYFASSLQRDPYKIVVAEVMLQQTQVERVLPKYEAWMECWPQLSDLATATLAEVLIFWQGLGYNRRARFLWLLAKEITGKRNGVWPTTEVELMQLPGIGRYTARALQSFAFGQQVGVVDTNVKRVLERVLGVADSGNYFALADEVLPPDQADPWNQALMDFGALLCTARTPQCTVCPLQKICEVNAKAKKNGFANFAEFLTTQKPAVKKKIRFEDTDRFFRGRIVDTLRHRQFTVKKLEKMMEDEFGLSDKPRFLRLITALEKEGIIQKTKGLVKIG